MLLGERCSDPERRDLVSLEKQVSSMTPPVFLWHTMEDMTVPPENSLLMACALRRHHIPLELHLYPRGAHGLSLGTEETRRTNPEKPNICPDVKNWITMAARWVRNL